MDIDNNNNFIQINCNRKKFFSGISRTTSFYRKYFLTINLHKIVVVTCVRVFYAPNATILLVYIPAEIKMSFIWKYDFFLPKSASSVSRSAAIFPSVFQAYRQPYLFGGRIKLITCQMRPELTIAIHEISTSWKNR